MCIKYARNCVCACVRACVRGVCVCVCVFCTLLLIHYAGYGVDINIPATKLKGDKMVRDKKYSGRYVIAAVRHKYDGKSMDTEMLVYRDSIPQNPT